MTIGNVFWDPQRLQTDDMPSILAIGDSWFWYPFPGGSLLNYIGPLTASKEHKILAVGYNGAEAYDYVFSKYEKTVRSALKLYGDGLSAVFISGGGNDFAGFNDLRPLLLKDCSTARSAGGCFNPAPSGELYRMMDKISQSYTSLIGRILMHCSSPRFQGVFVHNYDYAIPSGAGLSGRSHTWLKAALDDAKVPEQYQAECIRHVLDLFTQVLENIVVKQPHRVVLVKSNGTLKPEGWANELHPKPHGFKKIADERWGPVLRSHGLAS